MKYARTLSSGFSFTDPWASENPCTSSSQSNMASRDLRFTSAEPISRHVSVISGRPREMRFELRTTDEPCPPERYIETSPAQGVFLAVRKSTTSWMMMSLESPSKSMFATLHWLP
eukprot:CAMPEP_0173182696 /NCGR_PEP_ID=MMETSP1141-20130122/7987_1 /TAXON_ID=483371 /ORGANISM="non described non described, Strain CCMP2298" /LENGTH=114 /DNA_ID=CAMNT_0014105831 /DNA_START=57 /DNA_END=397 /DNA_ORIENTATION=-